MTFFKCVCRNLGNPAKAPFSQPGGACWQFGSTSLSKGHQVRDRVQLCVQCSTVGGTPWVLLPMQAASIANGLLGTEGAGCAPRPLLCPLPLKIPFIQENAWKRGECMTVRAASALTLFGPGIEMTFPAPLVEMPEIIATWQDFSH